jgi:hypothetical protein
MELLDVDLSPNSILGSKKYWNNNPAPARSNPNRHIFYPRLFLEKQG